MGWCPRGSLHDHAPHSQEQLLYQSEQITDVANLRGWRESLQEQHSRFSWSQRTGVQTPGEQGAGGWEWLFIRKLSDKLKNIGFLTL